MKYVRTLLIMFIFLVPYIAEAAGLVPCSGTECTSCDFVALANKVIMWLISATFLLFAVLAVMAGLALVTSGGDTSAITTAKSKFYNAFIGLIIILAAFLLVDTMMRTLLLNPNDVYTGYGPWSEIKCGKQATPTAPALPPTASTTTTTATSTGTTTTPTTSACTPLNPITDPLAQKMESGTKVIWDNTDPRLQVCAAKLGGTVTSAYRPQAYQDHLKEIRTKWCDLGLASNTDASCAAVKSAVSAEMSKHGLSCSRPVATVSNHTSGIAIDISGGNSANAGASCFTWFGPADPVHYTLITGCTCP